MTVYAYSRVSSDKQIDGTSLDIQQDDQLLKEIADKFNTNVSPKKYIDEAKSAYTGNNLNHALGELISDVERGTIAPGDIIVMRHLDRLSRLPLNDAIDVFNKLLRHQIQIYTTSDCKLYRRDDISTLLMAVVSFNAAHEESAKKAYYTYQNAKKKIQKFRERASDEDPIEHIGAGSLPFYISCKNGLVVKDDKLFTAMQDVVRSYIEGKSLRHCVGLLKSKYGHSITVTGLSSALSSKALLGIHEVNLKTANTVNGGDVEYEAHTLEAYFPPICTQDEFEQIQRQKKIRYKSNSRKKEVNLLSGIGVLECGCGSPMYTHTGRNRGRYYKCDSDCHLLPQYTLDKLTYTTMMAFLISKRAKRDENQISTLRQRILSLEAEYEDEKVFFHNNRKRYDQKYVDESLGKMEIELDTLNNSLKQLIAHEKIDVDGQIAGDKIQELIEEFGWIESPHSISDENINDVRQKIPLYIKQIKAKKDGLVSFVKYDGEVQHFFLPKDYRIFRGLRYAVKLLVAESYAEKKDIIDCLPFEKYRYFTEDEIRNGEYIEPYISLKSLEELHTHQLMLVSPKHTLYRPIDTIREGIGLYLDNNNYLIWTNQNKERISLSSKQWQTYKPLKHYIGHFNIIKVSYTTLKGSNTRVDVLLPRHLPEINPIPKMFIPKLDELPFGAKEIMGIELMHEA